MTEPIYSYTRGVGWVIELPFTLYRKHRGRNLILRLHKRKAIIGDRVYCVDRADYDSPSQATYIHVYSDNMGGWIVRNESEIKDLELDTYFVVETADE